ncbi:galactose ABC transporter ATP-binding protein [Enterocloster citroniae]|uniref:galactose ABC transporter ATP-binding protein n=1 Tax=Enterocloster citroniae TaxID=358743 RepID=UPI00349E517E
MGGDTEIVLETRELYKAFPGTIATNNVSFDVHRQEIHAIIGENGAGDRVIIRPS